MERIRAAYCVMAPKEIDVDIHCPLSSHVQGVLCLLLFVTTMDEGFVLSLAVLLLAVSPIQSFPSGAPAQACSDLRPGPPHGGVPQTTPSPYELDVDMFEDLASNDGIAVSVT